jgi:N-acetyl-1-D-myo-inositol-2-amino-2-deoxy-alpha-D-glucopyranoside deacetylase
VALSDTAAGSGRPTEIPVLPRFSARTRLLVLAPHPDDETIGTGLLIQQVRAAGGEVRIVQMTPGDNNPWPQRWLERRMLIRPQDQHRWGLRRHAEMLQALEHLQVPAQALVALGWPDMGVTQHLLHSTRAAVAALTEVIVGFAPDVIAVPALDDRHPDHAATHVLMRLVLGANTSTMLLSYLVHGGAPLQGSFEIVGSSAQRQVKRASLAAHCSQMALSGRRMRRLAERPERYREVDRAVATARAGELAALPWRPPVWLHRWLRLSVVSATGACSWRWPDAPLQRDHRGAWHLQQDAPGMPPRFARLQLEWPTPWIFDHWGWCEL